MISPFEQTLRALSDASSQYEAELARFALSTQRVAKRDAAQVVHSAERLIRRTHAQLRSSSIAIRRRRRRTRRRSIQTDHQKAIPSSSPVAPRPPLQALSSNDVLAAAAAAAAAVHDGDHVRCVKQLPRNDRVRRPPVPPVPIVAALDGLRAPSPRVSFELRAASPAPAREDNVSSASGQSQQNVHEQHSASDTSLHRRQSPQLKPCVRDRRSTASVDSYDTAYADFSVAHAVPDTDTVTSPPAHSRAELLCSQPNLAHPQSEHPQLDRRQPSPSVKSPAVASSTHEQSPCSSPPHVPLQNEEQTNTPEQVQQMQQTAQSKSNQSLVPKKLSESLHSGHDHSRSSAHAASSFENDAPADDSDHHTETKSAEQEMNTQPDRASHSPHSNSRTERLASFSPLPQSEAKQATPESGTKHQLTGDKCSTAAERGEKRERSPEAEAESNADDALPESIHENPVPAVNLQIQQPPALPDTVQVEDNLEPALSNESEREEPKLKFSPGRNRVNGSSASQRSQQSDIEHQVDTETHSIQSRGRASDAALAKKVNCSSDTKPVAERETVTSEAVRFAIENKSSGTPEILPSAPSSMPGPQQVPASRIPRKPSRILVDNAGKIDHSSLSVLSRIISTKSVENTTEDTQINKSASKLTTPRTTKLFRPNNNIYSLQQTGNVSPVQRFSSSNRSSVLSHTPGAEVPFRKHSPGVSRHQRLESLNRQLESFQNSEGAGLQGPELQMAELRHGRTGAQVLGDLGNPKVSQLATESENVFRSVRERTLKLAETHVKDTSKVDIWSLRAKGAKTTPARDKLRARERSKSKSAFRSQLQEIMTGKACGAKDDEDEENKGDWIDPRFLESSRDDDSIVRPKIPDDSEEKLSRKLSRDGDRSKLIVISPAVAQGSPAEPLGHLEETQDACLEVDNSDKRNDVPTQVPAASSSEVPVEEQSAAVSDVCMADTHKVPATNAPLTNLMTSIVSFLPGSSSLLGTRPTREKSEESEAEAAAKRHKLDMERREAEVQARREAQRLLKQKETEEKQRRAEKRRLLLARADKEKEEEKRKKEERRMRKKLEEEEARKRKKQEDDRKKEERRRLVLEKKAQNEMKLKRKKKGAEHLPPRKVPKGISRKSWVPGQGASQPTDADFPGHEKHKLSATPSTPVTKKTDASHGQSNYDMTPAQETVFELSDEEEERRKHKRIPPWAQGPKLSTAARDQPDPDDVFVNVPTCDLREVFGNVRRFRPRSSSANWTRDRVTAQEMVKFRKGQAAFNEPPQ